MREACRLGFYHRSQHAVRVGGSFLHFATRYTDVLLSHFSLFVAVAVPAAATAPTSSLLGDWVTPNKSVVSIYNCQSALCAKIAHVDPAIGHSVDGLNPDKSKRDRPLCGLVIGTDFQAKDAAHAEGGKLYDPESGNTYSGTLALTGDGMLKLRGYIGVSLFGRSETWTRAQAAPSSCS